MSGAINIDVADAKVLGMAFLKLGPKSAENKFCFGVVHLQTIFVHPISDRCNAVLLVVNGRGFIFKRSRFKLTIDNVVIGIAADAGVYDRVLHGAGIGGVEDGASSTSLWYRKR